MEVILDTSFILTCIKEKIDFLRVDYSFDRDTTKLASFTCMKIANRERELTFCLSQDYKLNCICNARLLRPLRQGSASRLLENYF